MTPWKKQGLLDCTRSPVGHGFSTCCEGDFVFAKSTCGLKQSSFRNWSIEMSAEAISVGKVWWDWKSKGLLDCTRCPVGHGFLTCCGGDFVFAKSTCGLKQSQWGKFGGIGKAKDFSIALEVRE